MRALAIFALALSPAMAQSPASGENGRFQMTPAPNGFLRLDTRTGAVSVCTLTGAAAECRAAADDRAALMDEVERLTKRNADLESSAAKAPPAAGPLRREDMGKAMDFAEEFIRRMMRAMKDESKDRT